jgi:hypothetical protein
MYNFWLQAYLTYKGLFYWLNWISYITNIFIAPAIFVMSYSILGRFALGPEAALFYGLGIAMSHMTFILIGGITQAYTYDRDLGTISFLYVSPANRLVNFLSRPVLHYPNALLGILLIFTGMMIPLEIFPPFFQGFANILPVTNGLAAIRDAFNGAIFSDVYLIIVREALVGLAYLTLGFIGFTVFERVAKRTGVLEQEAFG